MAQRQLVANDDYFVVRKSDFLKIMEQYGSFVNGVFVPKPRTTDPVAAAKGALLNRVIERTFFNSVLKGYEVANMFKQKIELLKAKKNKLKGK